MTEFEITMVNRWDQAVAGALCGFATVAAAFALFVLYNILADWNEYRQWKKQRGTRMDDPGEYDMSTTLKAFPPTYDAIDAAIDAAIASDDDARSAAYDAIDAGIVSVFGSHTIFGTQTGRLKP
jgi:hypothetical protein